MLYQAHKLVATAVFAVVFAFISYPVTSHAQRGCHAIISISTTAHTIPEAPMRVPISVFTSHEPDRLTKSFTLENDQLVAKPGGNLWDGQVERVEVEFPHGFADLLAQLAINQACGYGVPNVDEAHITTRENVGPGDLARIRENFRFIAGLAILMIDYDIRPGTMPLTREELVTLLVSVCPEIADCALVITDSASTHIVNAETGEELKGEGGKRVYLVAQDGRDISRSGMVLFDRLVLAGHGYVQITKAGTIIVHTPIDGSVWQPERLDFAAGAHCGEGLVQRRPSPTVKDGGALDTVTAFTALTPEEKDRRREIDDAFKADAQDEADAVRAAWIEDRIQDHGQRAGHPLSPEQAQRMRDQLREATASFRLPDDFVLHGKDGEVTVGELLADPESWNGAKFADPLEPDYHGGERLAQFIVKPGRPPYITSFAHGGQIYGFQSTPPTPPTPPSPASALAPAPLTFASFEQRVLAIDPKGKPEDIDAALENILDDLVAVGASTMQNVKELIRKHLSLSAGNLDAQLKNAEKRMKIRAKKSPTPAPAVAASSPVSGSPATASVSMDVRCDDGLATFTSDLKPHLERLSQTHNLFVNGNVAKTVSRVNGRALTHYSFGSEEVANLVYNLLTEVHVRFVRWDTSINAYIPTTPPPRELKTVLSTPEKYWPIVHHWCDGPMLLPNGEVLQPGFTAHNNVGYYGQYETSFVEMSVDEAMAVLRETLSEVSFRSEADFANALALRFTCALRHYLGPIISPLFLVVATERQSGKTALVILLTCVCKTSVQLCTPSMDEAEIEKRFATAILNGFECYVLDNMDKVPIGTFFEGTITKAGADIRLLGKNVEIHTDLRPVIVADFNIDSQNDLSDANNSRAVLIELETRGSAASRQFQNRYLLAQIEADEGGIRTREVNATLSLALAWIRAGAPIKTDITCRFPRWADTISGLLSFLGIAGFMTNRDRLENLQDPSVIAWGPVLHALYLEFGDRTFAANQVLDLHRSIGVTAGPAMDICLPVTGNAETDKRNIGIALSKATTWRFHQGTQYRCVTLSGAATKTSNRYRIERNLCTPSGEGQKGYPAEVNNEKSLSEQGEFKMNEPCMEKKETSSLSQEEEKQEGVPADQDPSSFFPKGAGVPPSPDLRNSPVEDQNIRRIILDALADGSAKSLGRLGDETGIPMMEIKLHLPVLVKQGFVVEDDDGHWVLATAYQEVI